MFHQPSNRSSSNRPNRPHFSRPRFSTHGRQRQSSFNPTQLINRPSVAGPVIEYKNQYTFNDFNLVPQLKSAILQKNYTIPTPIQDQAIPALLQGRDVVGQAATGTGKTAAFLIPLINKVLLNRSQKVLIIAPTRELALQIQDELKSFTHGMGIYSALCIGGASIGIQTRDLRRGPQFVLGTPGRLKDLHTRRMLNLNDYANIVLDEVDRMLDMGFLPDVQYLVTKLAQPRQSLFFSATLTPKMHTIMASFLNNPVKITVAPSQPAVNVDQTILRTEGRNKVEILCELLVKPEYQKVLVFGRTKHGIEKLFMALEQKRFKAASIHGNKSQFQRQRALSMFKSDNLQVLLATDVASRGLDISDVTHVINFDLPESQDAYIHRIGRTGRAGKRGVAITFLD